MGRIKQTLIILLAAFFLMSVAAAAEYSHEKEFSDNARHGGHYVIMHEDNGKGNDGVNNGQGNAGTPGYDKQQDGDHPGEHMGSEYTRVPV